MNKQRKFIEEATRRVLDVSTSHITEDDAKRLREYANGSSEAYPSRIMDDEYGTLVHIPDDPEITMLLDSPALDELSEEYWNIIKWASENAFDYIIFDCDAPENSGWPTFEW